MGVVLLRKADILAGWEVLLRLAGLGESIMGFRLIQVGSLNELRRM